jgi:hypothetical protein
MQPTVVVLRKYLLNVLNPDSAGLYGNKFVLIGKIKAVM